MLDAASPRPGLRRAGSSATCTPHKVPGYAAVTLSLKKTGVPPGDVTAEQMDASPTSPTATRFGELRVTHEQNLVLPTCASATCSRSGAKRATLGPRDAEHRPAHRHHRLPGRRLLRAGQRPVDPDRRRRSSERFDDLDYLHDIGELELNISRLHQRLRPPPRRPHRHPRRRQERRGVVPDRDRRQPGQTRPSAGARSARSSARRSRAPRCPT